MVWWLELCMARTEMVKIWQDMFLFDLEKDFMT